MKQIRNFGIAALMSVVFMLGTNATANAQRVDSARHSAHRGAYGSREHAPAIPNLTADQQKKIEVLRTSLKKDELGITNQLAEKRAHLHTLQTADKVDMGAVNSTIDDIGQLQSQLMKKNAANHEAVRKLLTDEQRVAYDTKSANGHRGRFQAHGGGHRGGHGGKK